MKFGILLTNRCNALCDHCMVSSGPRERDSLDEATVFRLINEASALRHQEDDELWFSGGEVFLLYDLLLAAVRRGAAGGWREIGCVSNGFWGTSEAAGVRKLAPLQEAGMTQISFSADSFHGPYVPIGRLRNALRAAKRLSMPATLKLVYTRATAQPADLLAQLGEDAVEGVGVQEIPCYPVGRARDLIAESDLIAEPGIPQGPCPGASLTVDPRGDVHFCCNGGGWTPSLSFGNVHEEPLPVLWQRYYTRGLHHQLLTEGPASFVEAIRARGLGGRLREEYVDVCHFCFEVFHDPEVAAVIDEVVAARELDHMRRLLGLVGGSDRLFTAHAGVPT